MKLSPNGLAFIAVCEGCKLYSYPDSTGVWTIGYGHTSGVHAGMVCTQEQANDWLDQDSTGTVFVVNKRVDVPLTQNQFDALVDFVYNEGESSFAKSTLLRLLNLGQYENAAAQFARWDIAGGQVLPGLLRRRELERDFFLDPSA